MKFNKKSVKELNSILGTTLNENMSFTEVYEELDRTNNRYFYISLSSKDVIQAIEEEKEIANQLGLWLVELMPQGIYIALYS